MQLQIVQKLFTSIETDTYIFHFTIQALPVAFLQKYTPFFFRRINFSSFRYDDSTQQQYQSPQQQYTSSNQVSCSKFQIFKFSLSLTRISFASFINFIETTTEKRRFLPAKNCQNNLLPELNSEKNSYCFFPFLSFLISKSSEQKCNKFNNSEKTIQKCSELR